MTTKTYRSYTTRVLASGEVRRYEIDKKYKVNNAYVIPDDKREEIIRRHNDGVPSTRIAQDIGITVHRVRRVIKKAVNQSQIGSP